MNSHLEMLVQLVAPPARPSSLNDWGRLREELGFDLPGDYVDMIDTFGGGRYDEYLWVLEPNCVNRHYDLQRSMEERADAFEMLREFGESPPVQLSVRGSKIIPWASTDNGEFLYWLALPGVDANEWTVMVNEARGDWWEHFHLQCSEFLTGLLTGEIRSEILSSSFPLPVHEFRPSGSF